MSTPEHATVGRYELRGRLGSGGMGTVWHAFDPILQRDVAVKEVLLPDGMSEEDRNEAHARTLREAQATARIHHSAIVTVHDVLEHDGSPWIVMELLSGSSLHHHIETHGPMPVERVEEAARALLGGLKAAHAVGVTHRDVKPANIMLTEDDRTVLMDFGIANVDGSAALTQTGVYIGSPEYMAPERFEGERALPASDLWSLGVTLYSLLEGRSPFKRGSVTGMISAVLTAPVPPHLSRNEAAGSPRGAALQALISALLTRETGARPSPSEALELLERERRNAQRDVRTRKTALPEETPVGPAVVSKTSRAETGANQSAGQGPGPGRGTSDGGTPAQGPPARNRPVPSWGQPTPAPRNGPVPAPRQGRSEPRFQAPQQAATRPRQPSPIPQRAGLTTEAARHFLEGTGYTPNGAPVVTAPEKPAGVLTAMGMLGLNAVALFVFTIVTIVGSVDSAASSWGTAAFLGTWGLLSAAGALTLVSRSQLVFTLVLIGQACGAVFLGIGLFEVVVHAPDLIVFYALALLYTVTIGGLLVLPTTSRTFFRLG